MNKSRRHFSRHYLKKLSFSKGNFKHIKSDKYNDHTYLLPIYQKGLNDFQESNMIQDTYIKAGHFAFNFQRI